MCGGRRPSGGTRAVSIGYCSSATPESSGERCCSDRLNPQSKADVTLLNFDVRFTPNSGHSPTRSGCLLWADIVAKRFLVPKRGIIFQERIRIENIDLRIPSFGFCYCLLQRVDGSLADFCNTIGQKQTYGDAYSITSSARASTDGGTVRPRALAVLRLITSSNLVVRTTGKSAGFAPFRILAV